MISLPLSYITLFLCKECLNLNTHPIPSFIIQILVYKDDSHFVCVENICNFSLLFRHVNKRVASAFLSIVNIHLSDCLIIGMHMNYQPYFKFEITPSTFKKIPIFKSADIIYHISHILLQEKKIKSRPHKSWLQKIFLQKHIYSICNGKKDSFRDIPFIINVKISLGLLATTTTRCWSNGIIIAVKKLPVK